MSLWRLGPLVAVVVLLGGCDANAPAAPSATSSATAPGGGSRLLEALAHVADSDATRARFDFSDVAFLGTIGGPGWAGIRYQGARNVSLKLVGDAGLPIGAAQYAVTAGEEPRHVIVFAGGQDVAAVAAALRKLGWTADGDRFVAPAAAMTPAPPNDGGLIPAGQARASGADLLVGGQASDLADAAPAGRATLAQRPAVAALAGCLGDVVAALGRFRPAGGYLAVAAAGVRRPASAEEKPRAVLCTATKSASDAEAVAEQLRQGFRTGRSAQQYGDVTVTVLGGPEHLVRAEATAAAPGTMLFTFAGYGLPGETGQPEV
ncbi:hypothetical protein [Dactylosporangium sp. CA-139066]|uniref:hypothetical protein n=1 Tax=Dactylosporangium sp. CA-139066 TaxID=3239930 RepID=UPI003D904DE4